MIVNQIRGNIFAASQKRIAFAVNKEGINDDGFAGQISDEIWPQLADTGGNNLGEVLTHVKDDVTYYAIVCHSLDPGGWKDTPTILAECLDKINIPPSEEIAIVLMGSGLIGLAGGADVTAILKAMEESKNKLVVYKR